VKGREWKVGKGRSRGLLLKNWIEREERGRERKVGEGEKREGSSPR